MNVQFESTEEETTVISAPVLAEIPENVDPAQAETLLTTYESQIAGIPPISQQTLQAYGDCVETLKLAEKRMETIRLAKSKQLRDKVDEINNAYNPFVTKLNAMWRRLVEISNRFIDEQQRIEREEQARVAAEAEKARIAALQEAEKNRQAAEAARAQGNEREAVKFENKANLNEMKAEHAVAPVIQQTTGKVATGSGGGMSFGGGKDTWALVGWDKKKALRLTDPLLKNLVGDLDKLPEGVRFLIRMSDLNPVYLNKAFGGEEFPKPFTKAKDYSSARRS